MKRKDWFVTAGILATTVAVDPAHLHAQFDDVSNWTAFYPGANDIGDDPDGYEGAVFDGRYVYFAPGYNGTQIHGEVLRYDTEEDFAARGSWKVYDPSAHAVGYRPRGYREPAFDGRYVYFAPFHNGEDFHGEVLRYDTTADFETFDSWTAFDAGEHSVGYDADGYSAAVFDGQYVYFAPAYNGNEYHGEVLRYDTSVEFIDPSAWDAYDPGSDQVGNDPDGYWGGVFDGRYVYFAPGGDEDGMHGEVLRFDASAEFHDPSSWETYDPENDDVGVDPDGFSGAVFDGRYVYFVPIDNGNGWSSEVLRYDTMGVFTEGSSWIAYDPESSGLEGDVDGFMGGVFDGRYVYFIPHSDQTPSEDKFLRYDTTVSFTELVSWKVFDPVGAAVGSGVDGRYGGVFDGRYVYFSPANYHQDTHGEVLRYDTAIASPTPTGSEWGMAAMALLILIAGTIVGVRMRHCAIGG